MKIKDDSINTSLHFASVQKQMGYFDKVTSAASQS